MPTPTIITDLSTTAASNYPAGSESPNQIDDYFRSLGAVIRQEAGGDFIDVASAATINLGTTASRNIRITGTTTITSFGTVAAGVTRQVRFAGVLTLTHNATSLILPGGANITTTANDFLEAVSLGSGNWIVTNYNFAAAIPAVNGGTGQASYTVGDLLYASSTTALSKLAATALNQRLYSGGVGTAPFWGAGFKIITVTRDTTTASGSVAYTGVGFKPSALIAFGGVNGTNKIQLFGMTDGTSQQVIADNSAVSAGTYDMTGSLFYVPNTSGNFTTGTLSTFDNDGFTITWTKTGSPTGTATLYVLCMR